MFVVQVRNWRRSACIPLGACQAYFQAPEHPQEHANACEREDPIERKKLQRLCLYEISCHDCQMKYIGETKRSMKQRMTEHRYTVRKVDGCVEWHSSPCTKTPTLHQLGVCQNVCYSKGYSGTEGPSCKAIQVWKEPHSMSLGCGLHLQISPAWNPFLDPT